MSDEKNKYQLWLEKLELASREYNLSEESSDDSRIDSFEAGAMWQKEISDKEIKDVIASKNEQIGELLEKVDEAKKSSKEWCDKAMGAAEQRRSVQIQLDNLKRDYDFLVMARGEELVNKIDSLQQELQETYDDRQRLAVLCQDRNEQISKMREKFDRAVHLLEHSLSFVGTKSCSSEGFEAIEKFLKDLNWKTK
jgi:uncharacterized coiled-coil DUF342 family protein